MMNFWSNIIRIFTDSMENDTPMPSMNDKVSGPVHPPTPEGGWKGTQVKPVEPQVDPRQVIRPVLPKQSEPSPGVVTWTPTNLGSGDMGREGYLHKCTRCTITEWITPIKVKEGRLNSFIVDETETTGHRGISRWCCYCRKAMRKPKVWLLFDEKWLGAGDIKRCMLSLEQERIIGDRLRAGDRVFVTGDGEDVQECLRMGTITTRWRWEFWANAVGDFDMLEWETAPQTAPEEPETVLEGAEEEPLIEPDITATVTPKPATSLLAVADLTQITDAEAREMHGMYW